MNHAFRVATRVGACLLVLGAALISAQPGLGAQAQAAAAAPPARMTLLQGWTVFWGRSGLVLPLPVGWQVEERDNGAFVAFHSDSADVATAVIFVLPIAQLSERPAATLERLGAIAPELFPAVRVAQPQIPRPGAALAGIRFIAGERAFRGAALCVGRDRQGMLYVMAAQEQAWQSEAPVMTRILTGFFYSPVAQTVASARPAPLEMVTWRDPTEGAFTVPVPKGWQVSGGIQRFHPLDLRSEVVAVSPDGGILVRVGDVSVPPMRVPDQWLQSMGFREESWFDAGMGLQVWLLRYLRSTDYLQHYYLKSRLGEPSKVNERDYPELSRQLEGQWRQATLGTIDIRFDTGEMTFELDGGQRRGYAFAQTRKDLLGSVLAPEAAGWFVSLLFGYVSTPQDEAIAAYVLQKMVSEWKVDPVWYAERLKANETMSGIIAEHNAFMNDMLERNYRAQTASEQRISDARTRALRGETIVRDPTTGIERSVPSGHNYYWLSGPNTVIGTETADPSLLPNALLQQLEQVH